MNATHDPGPTLLEAAPYIARFRGQHVVVKLGGELFDHPGVLERLVPQLAVLHQCGLRPVLVHGGGKQIDDRCRERGIAIEKRDGRRITSPAVLEVVLEVVAGELNARFCELFTQAGVPAKGFAAGLSAAIRCRRRPPRTGKDGETIDFGEVGDVTAVDTSLLLGELGGDDPIVPVLPSIGETVDGQRLNVNADSVAAQVAKALGAQKLVMLSSVPGVLKNGETDGPISQLKRADIDELLAGPHVVGGMRAKLEEAKVALDGGVAQVHILSGVEPQTVLREIFTEEGCGTLIY